jgi:hypothetical protein
MRLKNHIGMRGVYHEERMRRLHQDLITLHAGRMINRKRGLSKYARKPYYRKYGLVTFGW